jgi:hypothetical protein
MIMNLRTVWATWQNHIFLKQNKTKKCSNYILYKKITPGAGLQQLMPIILATGEAETRRITV